MRPLTSEEAVRQQCYYNCNAGGVDLQPRDVIMISTNQFMGKHKVKDWWHNGGYVVVNQLGDWPVYRVKCLPVGKQYKHTYQILLMLVPSEDDPPCDGLQVVASIILNADIGAFLAKVDSTQESEQVLPSLLTRQNGELTPHVCLNGEFCTKPWT